VFCTATREEPSQVFPKAKQALGRTLRLGTQCSSLSLYAPVPRGGAGGAGALAHSPPLLTLLLVCMLCCQVLGCGMWPFWHRMHGICQQGCKGELVLAGAATEGREHACVFCSGQTRMDLPEDSVPLPSGAGISHERARGQASLVGCGVAHILCSVQSSSRRRALVGVSGQHSRVKICHLTDRKLQTLACADKSGLATRSEMWSLRQPRGCRSLVTGRVVLREL
jgi:hypothetical protein